MEVIIAYDPGKLRWSSTTVPGSGEVFALDLSSRGVRVSREAEQPLFATAILDQLAQPGSNFTRWKVSALDCIQFYDACQIASYLCIIVC